MCFAELQPTLALAETKGPGLRCFAEFGTHPATFPCGRDLPGRAEVVSGLWERGLLGPGTAGRCDRGVDGWQQGLSRGVSGWCLHYSAVLPQNLLRLWLVFAGCRSGDRDSWRRDDAGERVTKRNKGKRRDKVISCCDVILIDINYIENSMYYNT